ncbi:hypothetical protein ABH968_000258 [Lysinibacillus sp. RC79]
METLFSFSSIYLMPIYGFLFSFYLIKLLKKIIKGQDDTTTETSIIIVTFILIVWSISYTLVNIH